MPARRRRVRERVLQALYAHELSHEPLEGIISTLLADIKNDEVSHAFARSLTLKVVEATKELDHLISEQVEHWEFHRLAIIDKIILRMCICEFLYYEDIPPKVSINEAIEIARIFSTEKSDKFVNGVLDSVLDKLKVEGRCTKRGRGLLDTPSGRRRRS